MKVIGNLTKDAIIRAAVSEGLNVTQVIGTPTVFEAAQANYVDIAYDSNAQKVVISYSDVGNSNAGTAVVGTVSGNTISFGSPVVWEATSGVRGRITYDANAQKVVIAYTDDGNSGYATAIVGTVSGTSISFGTAVVFRSSDTIIYDITYDSNAQKVVVATRYQQSPYGGYGIVGTVSGTSISFGSPTVFNNASTGRVRAEYDTNAQKVVFAYEDAGNSSHGTAIVGTVSGTGISFGSEVVFEAAQSSEIGMAYDSDAQKIVIGYRDQGDSNIGKAIVGTVSGTSISFGTATAFGAGNDEYITVVYDSDAQKIVVAYRDSSTDGKLNVGTVSGTSISFGTETQFESGNSNYVNAVYEPIQKRVVIAYQDAGNSSHGTAVVTKTGYTSATGGTIADGKAVIVNANGTVSTVGQQTSNTPGAGSVTTIQAVASGEGANYFGAAFDSSNNKVVIAWADGIGNTNYGKAVVGTVSGDSISFGTPVTFESQADEHIGVCFDSNANKVVIAYRRSPGGDYGRAIVGTVSGTSISFGSSVEFNAGTTQDITPVFDSTNNKVVIVYRDVSNSHRPSAIVGTVSGTSISFGSEASISGPYAIWLNAAFDSANGKVVIAYRDYNNSNHGTAAVGTVSGTSISFGTPVVFNSDLVNYNTLAFDSSNNKMVISFKDDGAGTGGTSIVGTVSGTSISFGTKVVFDAGATYLESTFDSTNNKVIIAYADTGDLYYGKFITGTVSGTSISFGSEVTFDSNANYPVDSTYNAITFDSNAGKAVHAYEQYTGSARNVSAVVLSSGTSNLTSENYIGISRSGAASGAGALVDTQGAIADNLSGLTAGQSYYVQNDGTLGTTAADPSVFAGTAVSATKLIVKG